MRRTLSELFVDHPKEVGESYIEHFGASSTYGLRLMKVASMAFLHELNGRAMTAREERRRRAGVYDPGL